MSGYRLLELLRGLELEKIEIRHNPMTERYKIHASGAILHILKHARCLGWRKLEKATLDECFELVTWTDPLFDDACGFYSCFRLHLAGGMLERATFFCFYDGKDKSPCFKNEEQALFSMQAWAEKNKTNYQRCRDG